MADDARRTLPDLKPGLDPRDMDFFELLRRLEAGGQLFGHSGRPEREPARLGQAVRLGFATRSVADFHPGAERRAVRIEQAVIGLLGPEGPMPLHLTRWVLDRLSQRWFAGGAEGRDHRQHLRRFRQHAAAPDDRALLSCLGRQPARGAGRARGGRAPRRGARGAWPAPDSPVRQVATGRSAPRCAARRRRSDIRCRGRSG
jgi:hypothetical protein